MRKNSILRLARLILGLFLYSGGVAVTLKAQIGYLPWDVFHTGLARFTGMSIGTATIAAGGVIIALVLLLREKIGLGSILNLILVGSFLDLILWVNLIPTAKGFGVGLVMLIAGLFLIALGSYFYIGSGYGAGPRDSLMVALAKKTRLPIGVCRGVVELTALAIGWRLGGLVGLGTVIAALLVGLCLQLVFRLFRFDATLVKHQGLGEALAGFLPAKGSAPGPVLTAAPGEDGEKR